MPQHADGKIALVRGDVDAWAGLELMTAQAEVEDGAKPFYRKADASTLGHSQCARAVPLRTIPMRPRPGGPFAAVNFKRGRPRDRNSPLFDAFKRHVQTALDRSVAERKSEADGDRRRGGDKGGRLDYIRGR